MSQRTEKEFWVEMSIREIGTQAHFAGLAFKNLDPKAIEGTDSVFSSIHSFLSHCAMISKLLKAQGDSVEIGAVLGIPHTSPIHNREFRNHLEHYDERLKAWIQNKGLNAIIGTYNVGPKSAFEIPNLILVSHYDPETTEFTFVDENLDLGELNEEVERIKEVADSWVKEVEN